MQGTISADAGSSVATERPRPNHKARQADDTNVEAARFGPGALLDREVIVRLSKLRPMALASRLCIDYGLIAVTILCCEYFWHPGLYVLSVMVIGARQAGIGSVVLHDGVHRMLSKNRQLNDFMGRTICTTLCTTIVMGFDPYREHHFEHHREANTEHDPEQGLVEKFYRMPRWFAAVLFLLPLTGLLFVVALGSYLYNNWRERPVNVATVLLTTLTLLVGWWLDVYLVQILVMYWFLPLATWGIFTNQIRALAEHYPENEFQRGTDYPRVFRTRDVLNSWFDSMFMVTRGVNYHLSHHLCPQVPFYNLSQLQRELAKSEIYRQYAHVTHGYHRFLLEYFFQRSTAVGGLQGEH